MCTARGCDPLYGAAPWGRGCNGGNCEVNCPLHGRGHGRPMDGRQAPAPVRTATTRTTGSPRGDDPLFGATGRTAWSLPVGTLTHRRRLGAVHGRSDAGEACNAEDDDTTAPPTRTWGRSPAAGACTTTVAACTAGVVASAGNAGFLGRLRRRGRGLRRSDRRGLLDLRPVSPSGRLDGRRTTAPSTISRPSTGRLPIRPARGWSAWRRRRLRQHGDVCRVGGHGRRHLGSATTARATGPAARTPPRSSSRRGRRACCSTTRSRCTRCSTASASTASPPRRPRR